MELIFNPYGVYRWSPEGPVNQIPSPHLLAGAPGICSDLLRSVQMLNREWGAESNWKLPHLFIASKLQPWFLSLQWKTCLWTELKPWFLRLQWKTCPWAAHSDDYENEWMREWCVSAFMFLLSRRWPQHWAYHSCREALLVLVWSKEYVCDSKLIPSPDKSWLCKARVTWVK